MAVAHPCATRGALMVNGADDGRLYGSSAAAREAGISLRQLYYWVNVLRAVAPQAHAHGGRMFRRFTVVDVQRLRRMQRLIARGYALRAAVRFVRGPSGMASNHGTGGAR